MKSIENIQNAPPVTRRMSRRITFAMEPFAWRAYGLKGRSNSYRPTEIETIAREPA